jgi:hypothetical protein
MTSKRTGACRETRGPRMEGKKAVEEGVTGQMEKMHVWPLYRCESRGRTHCRLWRWLDGRC